MAGDLTHAMSAADVADAEANPDPRRWLTLCILILTVVLIALDTSVLNVAIPTMLRDLDTTVPALQWVITGYSLTFGSLLIISGRLGDIYGHRRMFIIGAALFGTGSFIAAISTSVAMLIIGEAIIEGIGGALMTPATLALISTTFPGKERAKAFAAWGAAAGAATAFGPVLGGFLTTNYSWRWAFGINVVVAPIAVIGALALMKPGVRGRRRPIDLPGAALITGALFLLVFALSDGGRYGWFEPLDDFKVAGAEVWPSSAPVSIVPIAILAAVLLVVGFVGLERRKTRRREEPLFDFSLLQVRSFRYGLLTTQILAMGQLALLFALPLFLQDGAHLTAERNGLWMLPLGLFVIVGAQIGGRMARTISLGTIITAGLLIESVALVAVIWAIKPGIEFWHIFPGLSAFGIGLGFASSLLSSVVLSEVSGPRAGVASGANSTCRQVGAAFGIAIVGSIVTVQATNRAVSALGRADLSPGVRDRAIDTVRDFGASAGPPDGVGAADVATIQRVLTESLGTAVRISMVFAVALVFSGALLSLLIPRNHPRRRRSKAEQIVDTFQASEPIDVDPARL
jgi:EmrB/QacA subfamily drug resistance transporter